jgi:biopolymer transport protein ExbD
MRPRRPSPRTHGTIEINATPLIDVVMCLIVFYLIVGKMAADQLSPMQLPQTALGSLDTEPLVLIINVLPVESGAAWRESNARVIVEGVAIADAPALAVTIASRLQHEETTAVQIRADRRLPFGAVEPVLRACAATGVESSRAVQIIAEQGAAQVGGGGAGGAGGGQ